MNLRDIERELLDLSTGEIVVAYSKDDFEMQKIQGKENKCRGYKIRKSKDKLNMLVDKELGTFYFNKYEDLLEQTKKDEGKFDTALALRFLYLCTYMDFEGVLMYGGYRNSKNHNYMSEKDLQEVLEIDRKQIRQTKERLIKLGLIKITEQGHISINKKYCNKGKLVKKDMGNTVRVFDDGIQKLYKSTLPKEHKKMGLLIPLLPYLNKQHNILCHNIEEQQISRINPLTIQEICKIVGYNVANARRLEKELISITVEKEPCFMVSRHAYAIFYTINPRLFYRGSDVKALEGVVNMFKVI